MDLQCQETIAIGVKILSVYTLSLLMAQERPGLDALLSIGLHAFEHVIVFRGQQLRPQPYVRSECLQCY